jgi:hypothetical protein
VEFLYGAQMANLILNPKKTDLPQMDQGSSGWLEIISRNDSKRRPCAVPKKYFDVLLAWGYVKGTIGNAEITPIGRGMAIELIAARDLRKKAEEDRNKKTKRKK